MPKLDFHPLTPNRWDDLKKLFGSRGACGGCWCMYSRLTNAVYERGKGAPNRRALKKLVDAGREPGILGYVDGRPVAWCSVAPREEYGRLARSRILAPVDEKPVWSITCLFVAKEQRRSGVSVRALDAAVKHARDRGARIVEGYPVEPKQDPMPPTFAWWGTASAFRKAGFREITRRSETRPIMRRAVRPVRKR